MDRLGKIVLCFVVVLVVLIGDVLYSFKSIEAAHHLNMYNGGKLVSVEHRISSTGAYHVYRSVGYLGMFKYTKRYSVR